MPKAKSDFSDIKLQILKHKNVNNARENMNIKTQDKIQ